MVQRSELLRRTSYAGSIADKAQLILFRIAHIMDDLTQVSGPVRRPLALEFARMIQEGEPEWLEKGLFWTERNSNGGEIRHPLNIRIGLHTGPVFLHQDPIVRRL